MKILRCLRSLNPAHGGPLESVTQSTLVLQRRGHEIEIATLDAPGAHDFPAPVHAFGPGRGSYGYCAGYVPWLQKNHARFDAGRGARHLAIPELRRLARAARHAHAVFRFPARHARSVVQTHLSTEACKETALLAVGGISRAARRGGGAFYLGRKSARLARDSFALYHAKEVVVNYGTAAPPVDGSAAAAEFFGRFPQLRGEKFFPLSRTAA